MSTYPQMLFKLPSAKATAMSAADVTTLQGFGFSTSVPGGWVDDPTHEPVFASPAARIAYYQYAQNDAAWSGLGGPQNDLVP